MAFCLVVPFTGFTQTNNPNLLRFSAKVVDEQLLLSWRTAGGFTCQDMQVQAATDTSDFEVVAIYPGICGDVEPKSYSLVVQNLPLNQTLRIRLDLGNGGYSDTLKIRIRSANESISILPNPSSGRFLISTTLKQISQIELISAIGNTVYSETVQPQQEYSFDLSGFLPGLYRVVLVDENGGIVSRWLMVTSN